MFPITVVIGVFVVLQMSQLILSGRLLALAHYFHDDVQVLQREHAEATQKAFRQTTGRMREFSSAGRSRLGTSLNLTGLGSTAIVEEGTTTEIELPTEGASGSTPDAGEP